MKNKYYTPSIEEFRVGFEYEYNNTWGGFSKRIVTEENLMDKLISIGSGNDRVPFNYNWRVKYLDKQDIESLGFNNTKEHAVSYSSSYKIKDNKVFQIQSYWDMQRDERENLIRIYIGDLHKYPYTEIFRGEIKNLSELKKLLKQLNIK